MGERAQRAAPARSRCRAHMRSGPAHGRSAATLFVDRRRHRRVRRHRRAPPRRSHASSAACSIIRSTRCSSPCTLGRARSCSASCRSLLPPLAITSFTQYVWDSKALSGAPLRASVLGRWNGIGYYVVVGTVVIREALELTWPGQFVIALIAAWALVVIDGRVDGRSCLCAVADQEGSVELRVAVGMAADRAGHAEEPSLALVTRHPWRATVRRNQQPFPPSSSLQRRTAVASNPLYARTRRLDQPASANEAAGYAVG